jgi:hypothetical protein
MARILSNATLSQNFIACPLKWPGHMQTKEVRTIKELTPLKQAIRELAWVGEEEHEGPLIDLAVLLSKIVRTYEHKGIHYTLQRYAPELIQQPKSEDYINLSESMHDFG